MKFSVFFHSCTNTNTNCINIIQSTAHVNVMTYTTKTSYTDEKVRALDLSTDMYRYASIFM